MEKPEAEDLLMRLQLACVHLTHATNTPNRGTKGVWLEIERVVRKLYKGLTGEAPTDEVLTSLTRW